MQLWKGWLNYFASIHMLRRSVLTIFPNPDVAMTREDPLTVQSAGQSGSDGGGGGGDGGVSLRPRPACVAGTYPKLIYVDPSMSIAVQDPFKPHHNLTRGIQSRVAEDFVAAIHSTNRRLSEQQWEGAPELF